MEKVVLVSKVLKNCLFMMFKKQKLELVLSLTNIRSPSMLMAFELHYITKMPLRQVVKFTGVSNSNFCKANRKYLETLTLVDRIINLKGSSNA